MENAPTELEALVNDMPDELWSKFSTRVKTGIAAEYKKLPAPSGDKNVDWMHAFLLYTALMERRNWVRDNITGLMVISAFMALAFGILGAWGLQAGGATKEATAGFLDIAKLFAGALVGAAGATAVVKR
jgi:hypothetical protein